MGRPIGKLPQTMSAAAVPNVGPVGVDRAGCSVHHLWQAGVDERVLFSVERVTLAAGGDDRCRDRRRPRRSNSSTCPAGTFWMGAPAGDGYADDGEGPVHEVELAAFSIAPTTVTNADFAAFCDATGHVTLAEADQWSFVFAGLLPDDFPPTRAVAAAPWWRQVEGSDWRHPAGPHTTFTDVLDHPVDPRHVGRRDGLLPRGAAPACRPRPSGSTPPAADSTGSGSRGATTSNRAVSTS